jgi:hypothetical protein
MSVVEIVLLAGAAWFLVAALCLWLISKRK